MEKKKIKVLRIINRFNLGGPTFNAAFLTRFINDEFETILVGGVHDEGETDSYHILKQYEVPYILIPELRRTPNVLLDRKAYKKIKDIIEIEKPDIVHTHASKAGFIGRKAAKSSGVPIILHTFHGHVFHSYFNAVKTKAVKMLERRLAKQSTGIIAISEKQKEELVKAHQICTAEKVQVIPLGFDLNRFSVDKVKNRVEVRKKWGIEKQEVAIAIIGRLAPVKDHAYFLDIIAELAKRTDQKIKVFIVGDGTERAAIEGRLKALNKGTEFVYMTSWILDIAAFNHGMDIICLTSKNEGTPVSLIEAQAAGLPVVTTDVGGIKDVVQDDQTGFVIKQGDIETYVEKLRLLVEDSNLRDRMGQNGHNFVIRRFHYSRLVGDMEKYYKELLGR
jgi:glycosyltransferase involved in cell wall biosynthesis